MPPVAAEGYHSKTLAARQLQDRERGVLELSLGHAFIFFVADMLRNFIFIATYMFLSVHRYVRRTLPLIIPIMLLGP